MRIVTSSIYHLLTSGSVTIHFSVALSNRGPPPLAFAAMFKEEDLWMALLLGEEII